MLKTEIGEKLNFSSQTVSQEIKSTTSVNTQVIRNFVWIDQTSRDIPLSQCLAQSKVLILFNPVEAERSEEAAEEKLEGSSGWFIRFKERSHLHHIKVHREAARADVQVTASYPEDRVKIINEGDYSKQQIFNGDETAFYWKKMTYRNFTAREENSVPVFKASKDRLALLLWANAAGNFQVKQILIYHSKTPRSLKNYANSTLPIPFKVLLPIDNASGHARALMAVNVFMPANIAAILCSPWIRVISIFQSYYLRNTMNKIIATIDSDSSDGSGNSQLKTLWKGFTILDAIKDICDSWEEVKIPTFPGIGKKLILTLMDDSKGLKTLVEEVTKDVVETARELELELEPEDVTELLDVHRKGFHDMESTPGKDAMETVEMTTEDLEYYTNLATLHQQKRLQLTEGSDDGWHFLAIKYCN
ncbi:hypothetical protein FD755_016283 [Muntiacus reevesi]|uniref:DDE-1 domain-containing protein n=1 Tax=Muntiacus reevesi TaxID=9886 RepID=A0A5N3XEW8_MUNRE|nr:hypothetical protein FD755_016283 [Muntiacus reevesi]